MKHRKLDTIIASAVFLVSLAVYIATLPNTVVFWDVAEFCAAAFSLQVEHPPGAPFFLLIARVASMIPLVNDIAVRIHFLSALSGAGTCAFLYLIIVRLIVMWRGIPSSTYDRIAVYGSASVGAWSLAFSQSFWFNAVEAEVFAVSMLLVSLIIWFALKWYERGEHDSGDSYILIIAYILGISVGVRMLAVLTLFPVMFFWYFREQKQWNLKSFLKFSLWAFFIFLLVYPGIVNIFPSMLKGELLGFRSSSITYLPFIVLLGSLFLAFYSYRIQHRLLNVVVLSFLCIVLGYSTYTMVYLRAQKHTPMNMNDPSSAERFVSYLNRDQYGAFTLYEKYFNRRWDMDPQKQYYHKKYSSDLDYLWRYQTNHMYFRYLGWNFLGREHDGQNAGIDFKKFFLIPFLLGLLGVLYQVRKQPHVSIILFLLFIVMGVVLALYQNQQEPQPRERDYFYLGSFFVFSLWIGFGVLALFDALQKRLQNHLVHTASGIGILILAFIFVPGRMLAVNYHEQNRKGNYVPWDYSYNLLQSCEQDAILITNGDNDTFPLWYLQDVEGVRRDIRVVNLSLANTPWYIKQLKHETPYGAKKVPLSSPDVEIENIQPIQFQPRWMELPVGQDVLQYYGLEGAKNTPLLDTSITNSGVLRFLMPNTLQFGEVKAIRAQDIITYDIIRTSNWRRPIYFAMTVGDDSKIGLRDYMQLTGLTFKLVPWKTQNSWASLDEPVLRQNLFTDVQEVSQTPQSGFLWRGFQDSTTYYDEDTRRLLMSNYRNMFISYALYCVNVKNSPQEISAILDRMEQVLPRHSISMDYRIKFDIATFYMMAGNKDRHRELTNEIIHELKPMITKPVREQLSQYNPFVVLYYCYEGRELYQEAEELLPLIKAAYPAEQGIDQIIGELRAQLQAKRLAASAGQRPY